ncbi:MAG TPA: VWA domain-containing protein [Terriglobales bacterium]|nr:VWA domain-containing protein [Terriglobales bacterium]
MVKRYLLSLIVFSIVLSPAIRPQAQEGTQPNAPTLRVDVNLVLLNVAVTDRKGNYVTGLRPSDFAIYEDDIPQKIATFGEGNGPQESVDAAQAEKTPQQVGSVAGANVFILFDTSNYMYRGFALAQDAIAEFVRSLDSAERVAFYAYSRDLYRGSVLTADRTQVLRGVRSTVAGDDPALYNALLLTLKDAGTFPGRKVVVVFSNGPDRASMAAPEDICELAQSEGVPIYVVSTREAKLDPISTTAFKRMAAATGGEAFFAKSWKDQERAFALIRSDVGHLYSLSYYPQTNPNRGWRTIKVKLVGEAGKKYHIRTRSGYRPQTTRFSADTGSAQ